jgi:anti-anti-sigma factor
MEFSITEYKHCDLIEISGRIDSYTSPAIEEVLKALMADGHYKMVIDLKNVTYLSSSGMLTLVNAQKQCKRHNQGEILLAHVSDQVLASLGLAGFNQLFEIHDDVVTAVGKF